MKKISFVVPKVFQANRIFDTHDPVNRDNSLASAVALKGRLNNLGIDISTQDIHPVTFSDLVIFENMPSLRDKDFIQAKQSKKKMFLNLTEWGALSPENDDFERHQDFLKIFTYQDDLVDNLKYFKINYSFDFPKMIPKDGQQREKFCTLIAGHKRFRHPHELYSKRIEAIRWFEKYHPSDFDLYGIGWDGRPSLMHYPLIHKVVNRIPVINRIMSGTFPSYRGRVERKREVLKKYKFAICYENASNVNGWITEKIFDCFFAGCVPVYWGAPNVADHIPLGTFVDKRDFSTYEVLYDYLKKMPEDKYMGYIKAISAFISGERATPFTIDYFVETLITQIEKEIG